MAGDEFERQEKAIIKQINKAIQLNNYKPITIVGRNGAILRNVMNVQKYKMRTDYNTEPYTDTVWQTPTHCYHFSNKNEKTPSLAGGGVTGIEKIVPGLAKKFLTAAHKQLVKMGFSTGENVPDIYGKVDKKYLLKILIGTKEIGGPIHFMFIGPMKVKGKYKNGTLHLNGDIYDSKVYAKKNEVWLRLRKRREDQKFLKDVVAKDGFYSIYGKSKLRGDSGRRLVVVSKLPKNAIVVNF